MSRRKRCGEVVRSSSGGGGGARAARARPNTAGGVGVGGATSASASGRNASSAYDRRSSVKIDGMIHASKQKRYKHIGDGITAISILVAVILGGSALQRNALLVEQLDELQAAHSGRIDELQAAHSGRIDELNATLARHAAWIQEQEEKVTVVQSTGVALPMVQPDAMPPCSSESPTPSIVYTHSALLDMDVMQTCSSMEGVSAWRSVMTLGGLIFDGTDPSAFASAVNSGLPGVYVLRLGEGGVEYAVDEAISAPTSGCESGFNCGGGRR